MARRPGPKQGTDPRLDESRFVIRATARGAPEETGRGPRRGLGGEPVAKRWRNTASETACSCAAGDRALYHETGLTGLGQSEYARSIRAYRPAAALALLSKCRRPAAPSRRPPRQPEERETLREGTAHVAALAGSSTTPTRPGPLGPARLGVAHPRLAARPACLFATAGDASGAIAPAPRPSGSSRRPH